MPWRVWESDTRLRSERWWVKAEAAEARGDWASEEARLRAKRDEALGRVLGF